MYFMAPRDRVITLRLNDEEHRRFESVARDMGLDVSAMIRTLVRAQEKRDTPGKKRDAHHAK